MRFPLGLVALVGCDAVFGLSSGSTVDGSAAVDAPRLGSGCVEDIHDPLRYFVETTTTVDHAHAVAQCTLFDMTLVVFDTDEEQALEQPKGGSQFWVGLSEDDNVPGEFAADDGCTPQHIDWHTGQPGSPPFAPCADFQEGAIDTQFCAASTQDTLFCETPPGASGCTATGVYAVVDSQMRDATDAATACASVGSHVVEINSSQELAAVEATFATSGLSGPFWVAATFENTSTSWDPTPTGCPVVFRWQSGQPTAVSGQSQSCVVHGPTGAEMVPCSSVAYVMCEKN